MSKDTLFDLTKVKIFRLDQLIGKTVTILQDRSDDGVITTAVDNDTKVIYVLQLVLSKKGNTLTFT